MAYEEEIKQRLQELQKQLAERHMFEECVSNIQSLLLNHYSYTSPSLQQLFYFVVCGVATILKTRYTSPGCWNGGLKLFQEAEKLVSNASERKHLLCCIAQAQEELVGVENMSEDLGSRQNTTNGGCSITSGYLFVDNLAIDPEPSQPNWTAAASLFHGESSGVDSNSTEGAVDLLQEMEMADRLDNYIAPEILTSDFGVPRVPPASKEVVAKLPVTCVTEETLTKRGKDAVCSICQENFVVDDKMQELPCNHMFHPPCLKSWLDRHNSCPICRHELRTDDHAYESWKEKQKKAANAIHGGE